MAASRHKKNFIVVNPNALERFCRRSLAMATPSVISINGIAICPMSSRVDVRNFGVSQSLIRNMAPIKVPHTSGSFSAFDIEPPPEIIHTPKVKL